MANRFRVWGLCLCLLLAAQKGHAADLTPADVYSATLQIADQVEFLQQQFHIDQHAPFVYTEADLQWHHVWAKCYTLLVSINLLRAKLGMDRVEPVTMEPHQTVKPAQVWGMCQRILTELQIVFRRMDVEPPVFHPHRIDGAIEPVDVYRHLDHLAIELNSITGGIPASYVYEETRRLNDDVNSFLNYLHIIDTSYPHPRLQQADMQDAMKAAMPVLTQLHRIQREYGLAVTDLEPFNPGAHARTQDVFTMVELLIAELQTIKAYHGQNHQLTPGAVYVADKTAVDVVQLLGFIAAKLEQISVH